MEIISQGIAGTLESSDIRITIEKNSENGIIINLNSVVKEQYGDHIYKLIEEQLQILNIKNVLVDAVDRGALDCTIKARIQGAIFRACKVKEDIDWEAL